MRYASLLLPGLLLFAVGCSPKYFVLEDIRGAVQSNHPKSVSVLEKASSFVMTLKPRSFYKNNIEESVLLPDNSSFLQSGALLLLDSTDVSNPKWHAFQGWVQECDHGPSCGILHQGQQVALASIKGSTLHDKTEYERITIFYGHVDQGSLAEVKAFAERMPQSKRSNIRLDYEVRLIGKGDHVRQAKGSGEDPKLVAVVEKFPDHLSIYALVDKKQTNIGVEKSIIFDFQQIYGEPLWLVREER
ncbi:MAG: hypothetical protein K9I85_16105 [Saprospiraceae bacterium]|nr:hypothetical protein [Saprospiraceae bacterium]